MGYEYKAVGAPEKGRKRRGAKTRSDRVAAALEDILQVEATDGWEYLRTDLIPVEERSGWFGRGQEAHRAVMVFRRALEAPAVQASAPVAASARPIARPDPAPEATAPGSAPDTRPQPLAATRTDPVGEDTDPAARRLVAD